jgi:hypothetical protein
MTNKTWLKTCIFVLFILFVSSPSQAFYKKKVLIGQFKNPADWNKSYDPGKIFAELLAQELTRKKQFQLLSIAENMQKMMDSHESSPVNYNLEPAILDAGEMDFPGIVSIQGPDPKMKMPSQKMDQMKKVMGRPWPAEMGRAAQKPALTKIRGTVLKFLPAIETSMGTDSQRSSKRESAELHLQIELVQNKTGRTIYKHTFKSSSSLGNGPFASELLNSVDRAKKPSSMNLVLDHLKQKVASTITEQLRSVLLEGEIIAINKNEMAMKDGERAESDEEILVNVGTVNGVRIGDLFEVHAMGLGLQDPYLGNDLGDIYVRAGVIEIVQAWDGFSKAISLGGKNYKTGFLIRSTNNLGRNKLFSNTNNLAGYEGEKVPWWEFHGRRPKN